MKNSNIQWCDHTFNPWIGCTKVSPGCANCYAERTGARLGVRWGNYPRRLTSVAYWRQPHTWNAAAERARVPAKVFCASLADWLDRSVPLEWLGDLLVAIDNTPWIRWQLLTKRPENWAVAMASFLTAPPGIPITPQMKRLASHWLNGCPPQNVWVGTSVENREMAELRIPQLAGIPASVRFLSMEPLLERTPLHSGLPLEKIHWVIVGGESGTRARACLVEWIDDVVRRCKTNRIPVFVKQLGAAAFTVVDGSQLRALPLFTDDKRGDPDEWPASLRVREFPTPVY